MLVSDYHLHVMATGDGAITFKQDGVTKRIVIPQENTIAMTIFEHYYYQLPSFNNKYYEIAKRIVQEIRKSGYVFKKHPEKNATYYPQPVDPCKDKGWNKRLSLVEELYYLHHELDLVKKRIYHNATDGGDYSWRYAI